MYSKHGRKSIENLLSKHTIRNPRKKGGSFTPTPLFHRNCEENQSKLKKGERGMPKPNR